MLAHFAICIPRYLVEVNVGLEIVLNTCLTMIVLIGFFIKLIYFFNELLIIIHAYLLNNSKLAFDAIAKIYFVTKYIYFNFLVEFIF